jgi:parvulin-like peptidyl-prolyl isomerase
MAKRKSKAAGAKAVSEKLEEFIVEKKEEPEAKEEETAREEETVQEGIKDEPKIDDKKKKIISSDMMKNIFLVILGLAVVSLVAILFVSKTPFDSVIDEFQKRGGEELLTIQKLSGLEAETASSSIKTFCPGFGLEEFYIASITSKDGRKSFLHIINPITGANECLINRSLPEGETTLSRNLLATVNGDPVTADEVTSIYNAVPENMRTNQTLQQSFDQVVNNKLLIQYAKDKSLQVSETEVDTAVNNFLKNSGVTIESLQSALLESNKTMSDFRTSLKNELLVQAAVLDITKSVTEVSEEDIWKYYEANKESIISKASSVSRQLMVYANDSNSDERLAYIREVAARINQTNFCEIVSLYSEDLNSKDTCGLYESMQGQLLPEYEQVVYNSTPGEVKLISSRLGFHIVRIENLTPEKRLTYDEAREEIKNYLVFLEKQEVLNDRLQVLRGGAKIIKYMPGQ